MLHLYQTFASIILNTLFFCTFVIRSFFAFFANKCNASTTQNSAECCWKLILALKGNYTDKNVLLDLAHIFYLADINDSRNCS